MPHVNLEAIEFLRHRRSYPPALLQGPGPSISEIETIITLGARVPDHGKLEPWRFVVLCNDAPARLAPIIKAESIAQGNPPVKAEKHGSAFHVPVVVAVIFSPVESEKVPEWEQFLSSGATCLGLVNAALASGYGACWLTGVASRHKFSQQHFGLTEKEQVVGFIHIGTRGSSTPPERPRPDVSAKTVFQK